MLYNKDWDKKPKGPDPYSLTDLIAWLETKDPDERYSSLHVSVCLLGQWAKHCDKDARPDFGNNTFTYIIHGKFHDLEKFWDVACYGNFGYALKAARIMLMNEQHRVVA